MLRYERFELSSSSVAGFTYRPTGQQLECGAKWLRGLADLARHAPGSRLLDGGSCGGGGEGPATAEQQPAAAGGAAAGGGGSSEHTPSGSDHAAETSWGSEDGEAGSSVGVAGRSDASSGVPSPSSGGGGGMQPPRGGQQQACWRVEICDLFCGCGGLSLGLLQALGPHAKVKWAVDLFPEALQTYAQCHPGGDHPPAQHACACAWLGCERRAEVLWCGAAHGEARCCAASRTSAHAPPWLRCTGARTFEEDVCSVLAASKAGREGYPPIGCPRGVWRVLVGGPPCQVRRSWFSRGAG